MCVCVCVCGCVGVGGGKGGGRGLQKPEHFHFLPSKMLSNTIFLINDQTPFYFFFPLILSHFFLA